MTLLDLVPQDHLIESLLLAFAEDTPEADTADAAQ